MKLTKEQKQEIADQQAQKNQTKESPLQNWKKFFMKLFQS